MATEIVSIGLNDKLVEKASNAILSQDSFLAVIVILLLALIVYIFRMHMAERKDWRQVWSDHTNRQEELQKDTNTVVRELTRVVAERVGK